MKKTVMGIFLTVLVSAVLMAGPAMAQNASDIPWSTMEGQQTTTVPPKPNLPDTYGGSAVSYVMIPPSSFFPWASTNPYTSNDFGRGQRWPTSGATDLVAPVRLPSGAKVIYLELDYYDNSASARTFGSLTKCPWTGSGCTYYPTSSACGVPGFICSTLAFQSTGVNFVTANLSADNLVVDNFNNQFIALAEPNASDGTERVAGMIVGYILQVSPGPGVATFSDVPTGSTYFKFVEALYASGITAGCGGGNFCPNTPVTRGQMAVFLASALGLQWN